jgi:taurine dioxygenase
MEIKPLSPFGVELQGFTYRTASEADLQAFEAAFRKHSLVLIRDPEMSGAEQIALMARLGPVAKEVPGAGHLAFIAHDPAKARPAGSAGTQEFGQGELYFHFDMSYAEEWAQWIVSLYGVLPTKTGGETMFLHGGRIYNKLDEQTKREIAGRKAVRLFDPVNERERWTREATCSKYTSRASQPLVVPHPYGYGEVLTAVETDTDRIVGMKPENSERILNKLFKALGDPAEVLTHKWEQGDLLIWDNRVLQHSRKLFDPSQPRILRRVGVGDEKVILRVMQNRIDCVYTPAVD